ncbi:hypothetical protein E3A20_25000 [Planctomyces bekefii]|uniref:Acyl-ACP thioesterase-like C-terminal domain-containing protein n=1 Tax=Planctomyces bekefii TaxID=1653850 RepID=A0A5C6M2U6_9PLAN|nr:hypothetical protein E3A20_25000 [Planctomyces bekefii]
MAGLFEYELQVLPADLDEIGHVNNLVYVKWLLDAAVAHSSALGCFEPRMDTNEGGDVGVV